MMYAKLAEVVNQIPIVLRESVNGISIHSFPAGYRGVITFAVHIEGNIGVSLLDFAELRSEGVTIGGWGGLPDMLFKLETSCNMAREIIALNSSGLLGTTNACRFDTQDVKARLTYGYPSWIIKPNHLKSPMLYEDGKVTFSESRLGTTGIKTGVLNEIEIILLRQAIQDYLSLISALGTTGIGEA